MEYIRAIVSGKKDSLQALINNWNNDKDPIEVGEDVDILFNIKKDMSTDLQVMAGRYGCETHFLD